MKIPFSDLEDQVIDGFYVDSMMKCCWAAQMEILEHIDNICEKYNIQYFAEWGSMLGAVRHHGIIPWDDDIDITMKRPDYNRFLELADKELPEGYHIMNYRNDDNYWDVMSRVVNTRRMCAEPEFLEKNHYFPFSTGIDIFPMDYIPADKKKAEPLKRMVNEVKGVADSYGEGLLTGREFQQALDYLEKLCGIKISRKGNVRRRLYDIVISLYATFQEDEAEEIALMPLWIERGLQTYPKKYFSDTVRLPFWKSDIPVPAAYDALLRQKYGTYMNMVRKGGSHDYPYYKKQIAILEKDGEPLFQFQYKNRIVREKRSEKEKIILDRNDLSVLENAHVGLYKLLMIQDAETAVQLLLKCQECAISLGNKAESMLTDCEDLIHSLEEYCEIIFQIYQMLQQGEVLNGEGVFALLQEQLHVIKNQYSKEYNKKKKVVFIVDKANRWKSLKSVWEAAKDDRNNIVSVIVIPYFYKRLDGTVLEQHYEIDLFPKELDVMDYRQCNLEQYQPDIIFINNPYDQYNFLTAVHPAYYSSNLVKYTDKLVYIPWFTLTEFTREDERGWQSMQHFVTVPGVVNADKVYVQSEQMKEAYVEYLTDWAGENTREIWEEKISGIDSTLMEQEGIDKDEIELLIPEEWKSVLDKRDGSRKKILLYNISATGFVEHGMKAVGKLKSVLQTVKESAENVALIWHLNKELELVLKKSYFELWKAYEQITEEYKSEAWGIYADNQDIQTLVSICDAYYGDACALSQAMVIAKKPVMIQNFEC